MVGAIGFICLCKEQINSRNCKFKKMENLDLNWKRIWNITKFKIKVARPNILELRRVARHTPSADGQKTCITFFLDQLLQRKYRSKCLTVIRLIQINSWRYNGSKLIFKSKYLIHYLIQLIQQIFFIFLDIYMINWWWK